MKKTALVSTFILFSAVGLANGSAQSNAQKSETKPMALSFEDIRAACLNPARFHNQIAPTNIQISCKDVQSKWVPDAEGSLKMGCARQVTASVISDKYSARPVTGAVRAADQSASCPRFKQVIEAVESVRAVTCDELVAFTGSSVEFCTDVINSLRASNPDAVATTASGRTIDLCGAQADAGQRGQN